MKGAGWGGALQRGLCLGAACLLLCCCLLLLLLLLLLRLLPEGGKGEEARSLRGRLRALAGGVGSPEGPPGLPWSASCILTSAQACLLLILKMGEERKPRMPFSLMSA